MDRRGFLQGLAAVVGGIALNEAVPLGRVWSFPKKIAITKYWPQAFVVTSIGERIGIVPALPGGALSLNPSRAKIMYGASHPIRIGDVITIAGINTHHPITNKPIPIFTPSQDIAEKYRQGVIGRAAGIEIEEEFDVWRHAL